MCIKINKVGKQEVGIWRVQKRYRQYGIPIWCLWPNIRFLPSTVTEKNATKNILDGRRTEGGTEVKQYTPSPFGERGYKNAMKNIISKSWCTYIYMYLNLDVHIYMYLLTIVTFYSQYNKIKKSSFKHCMVVGFTATCAISAYHH